MNVKQKNVEVVRRQECKTDECKTDECKTEKCKSGGVTSKLTYFV
jgi:hypothetical protein